MVIKKITLLSLALLFSIPSFAMRRDSQQGDSSIAQLQTVAQAAGGDTNLQQQHERAERSGRSAKALRGDAEKLHQLNTPGTSASTSAYLREASGNLQTQAFTRDITDASRPLDLLNLVSSNQSTWRQQYPSLPITDEEEHESDSETEATRQEQKETVDNTTTSFMQTIYTPSAYPEVVPSNEKEQEETKEKDNAPVLSTPTRLEVLSDNLLNDWRYSPATYLTATYMARRLSNSARVPRTVRQVLYGLQFFTGGAALATTMRTGYQAMYPHKSDLAGRRALSASLQRILRTALVKPTTKSLTQ